MTGIYEESEETFTKRTLVQITCDRCNAEIPLREMYDAREVEIRFAVGHQYPTGGHLTGWQVEHLCDVCVSELKILLEEEWGAKVIPFETDW